MGGAQFLGAGTKPDVFCERKISVSDTQIKSPLGKYVQTLFTRGILSPVYDSPRYAEFQRKFGADFLNDLIASNTAQDELNEKPGAEDYLTDCKAGNWSQVPPKGNCF